MARTIRHEVFGTLVPEGEGLLTFRRFPYMKPFWYPDPDHEIGLLDEPERGWVRAWERSLGPLAKVSRRSDVHSALASLGVYEVRVSAVGGGEPSAAQVETYRRFMDREEVTCRNACDALLRYYRKIRSAYPELFRWEGYPDARAADDLGGCVSFDGVHILRSEVCGLCPMLLAWEPLWDQEHRLEMVLHADQVLAIGPQAGGSLLLLSLEDYLTASDLLWGPDDLNDSERSSLDEFVDGYGLRERHDY